MFFAAPNKSCSVPLNLFGTYRYADLCSLTCVADSNLPALARHVKPNNRVRESNICTVRESKIRTFSTGLERGLTGLSLNLERACLSCERYSQTDLPAPHSNGSRSINTTRFRQTSMLFCDRISSIMHPSSMDQDVTPRPTSPHLTPMGLVP